MMRMSYIPDDEVMKKRSAREEEFHAFLRRQKRLRTMRELLRSFWNDEDCPDIPYFVELLRSVLRSIEGDIDRPNWLAYNTIHGIRVRTMDGETVIMNCDPGNHPGSTEDTRTNRL